MVSLTPLLHLAIGHTTIHWSPPLVGAQDTQYTSTEHAQKQLYEHAQNNSRARRRVKSCDVTTNRTHSSLDR